MGHGCFKEIFMNLIDATCVLCFASGVREPAKFSRMSGRDNAGDEIPGREFYRGNSQLDFQLDAINAFHSGVRTHQHPLMQQACAVPLVWSKTCLFVPATCALSIS